jgi:outer membrane protein insertion porin family
MLRLALALLVAGPAAGFAHDPDCPQIVANVHIDGLDSARAAEALRHMLTKPGQPYSDANAMDDIARLAESKLCRPVSVRTEATENGRVNVIFVVRNARRAVREVQFKNASHLNVPELQALTRVRPGMVFDRDLNVLACYEIQDHLKNLGYHFANVTLVEGYDNTHERVIFNICSGPKVRIRDVRIAGHGNWTTAGKLAEQIDTRKPRVKTWGDLYRPDVIENDIRKLEDYCRDQGYLRARVWRELRFSDDFQYVDVQFHVKEGTRYRVADWQLETTGDLPKAKLARIVRVKKGDFYDAAAVNADVRNLTDWGGWRGKRLIVKSILTEVPDAPGLVRVQYHVEDAPVHQVGEVIIVGNTVTRDDVIRARVNLQPGQILEYPELRRAEKNLRELGIFNVDPVKGIAPTVQVLDSPGNFKDILIKVEETKTGSLTIGVGFNTDSGSLLQVVLQERNFDPRRWPTSWAEVREGRAFRGGGQFLRIEFLPTPQVVWRPRP